MADSGSDSLYSYLLSIADDRLILGHRLAEWIGHAPVLEEDISMANIALDLTGQAQIFYNICAELSATETSADKLVYFRAVTEYHCMLMVEQPKGDWADTIVRQFLFDSMDVLFLDKLSASSNAAVAAGAAASLRENRYHLRHTQLMFERLGQGTNEGNRRMQAALDRIWPFVEEMFVNPPNSEQAILDGIVPDLSAIRAPWIEAVSAETRNAGLKLPEQGMVKTGGRSGVHSEYLVDILQEMQSVARTHPGASW